MVLGRLRGRALQFFGASCVLLGISLASAPFASAQATSTTNTDIEARARAFFSAAPIMVEIARCESMYRQFDEDGAPLHGGSGSAMIGVYQINEDVHRDYALSLGMNIDTVDGNFAYAKRLYDKEGTQPWLSSYPCWGTASSTQSSASGTANANGQTTSDTATLTEELVFGMIHPQVVGLQQLLNRAGFPVATEGPGSPGQETTKFGNLTRAALRKFQCAQGIACSGDEYTSGYGVTGSATRTALLSIAAGNPPSQNNSSAYASDEYSPAELQQIEKLKEQIAALQKILIDLLAAKKAAQL